MLHAWRDGDACALEQLTPLVYAELHRIASRHMARERAGHTLQATALLHEACCRLMNCSQVDWQDRVHFFSVASRLMRRVLIDHARRLGTKRGGGLQRVPLQEAVVFSEPTPERLLALDAALDALARLDQRKGRIVELRFFGGLTVEETAQALGISGITVIREWNFAKAWLYRTLQGEPHA